MSPLSDLEPLQDKISYEGRVQNLTALTSLRFFAALFVVIHHTAIIGGNIYPIYLAGQFGWLGVSFFFILSGFVLKWSFDSAMPMLVYIGRRLSRIYPLHFICLTTCLVLFLITGHQFGGFRGTITATIENYLLMQDWISADPFTRQAWNGVSWTLSCEFFFYLIAPICFPALGRIGRGKSAGIAAAVWLGFVGLLVAANAYQWRAFLDFCFYNPLPRTGEFLLGALGAQWIKIGFRFHSIKGALVLMTLPVLLYYAWAPAASRSANLMDMLFIPGAFLLIITIAGNEFDGAKSWLNQPVFVRLGEASFALYMVHAILWHVLIYCFEKLILVPIDYSTQIEVLFIMFFIIISILFSIFVHLRFELPARHKLLQVLCRHTNAR
jgi:peptidoglycan/LPS O-acetylase OafA/YrhL